MKHLSANRNLGYTIQSVLFEELYFKWHPDVPVEIYEVKRDGEIWVNTYEFYEKMYNPYKGSRGQACNSEPVNGKYHPSVYELKKNIEQEGMQYPIPVMMNQSEQRLEHFSGMARIRYAMIHDYTSIDAIVSEKYDILWHLQETMRGCGLRDRVFSETEEYRNKINLFEQEHSLKSYRYN